MALSKYSSLSDRYVDRERMQQQQHSDLKMFAYQAGLIMLYELISCLRHKLFLFSFPMQQRIINSILLLVNLEQQQQMNMDREREAAWILFHTIHTYPVQMCAMNMVHISGC